MSGGAVLGERSGDDGDGAANRIVAVSRSGPMGAALGRPSVDGDLPATTGLRGLRDALEPRLGQALEQVVGQALRQGVTLNQLEAKL